MRRKIRGPWRPFRKSFSERTDYFRIAHRSSTTIDCHRHPPLISAGCQGRLFYRRPMQATSVYSKTQQRCSQSVPADGRPVPEQYPGCGDEDETGTIKAPGSGRTHAPESYPEIVEPFADVGDTVASKHCDPRDPQRVWVFSQDSGLRITVNPTGIQARNYATSLPNQDLFYAIY